ncbi:MAG: SDR family NAD(P)-dependent oxidoreductase [Niastella sp.]|uniref:SDR family NAD(P)-dependent oxidoreductase n=1 Tax=Niastella sp. TaxID=1869183 RepID=UPI00389AB58A
MHLSLEGKNAVICGSSQGIGLAIAEELALLGANCTLMARNEEALQAAIKTLDIALRQQHSYLVADFTKTSVVKEVIQQHVQQHPVHILVNNTGGPPPGSVLTATEEAFMQAFNQHLIVNQLLGTGSNSFHERSQLWPYHQYNFNFYSYSHYQPGRIGYGAWCSSRMVQDPGQ